MKRERGQYFTTGNPFNHPLFEGWLSRLPTTKVIEPFAGSMNIPGLVGKDLQWYGYDIQPSAPGVIERDTLNSFPVGYDVAITNPPYLAKNSATRLKMDIDFGRHDDLYKLSLERMLDNCGYVAAIIPNTFLTQKDFFDRLVGVVSLTSKMFDDTDCPACLALFVPETSPDFKIYKKQQLIGDYSVLKEKNKIIQTSIIQPWKMNDPTGYIGLKAIDGTKERDIKFVDGETIEPSSINSTNRSWTRISGPKSSGIIERANVLLDEYRDQTHDVFMSSFRGLRKDGDFRRRLSWDQAKMILNSVCK